MNENKKNIKLERSIKLKFSDKENFVCKCNLCGSYFKTWQRVGYHLENSHNITSEEYYKKYYKLPDEGICKECGKPTKFHSILFGYGDFCSCKCAGKNKETRLKCENTNLKLYGVKYTIQNKKCREKLEQTNIEKYGCKWNMSNEQIRQKAKETKFEKYGNENYSNREQAVETWKNHSNEFKQYIKEKREKTCFEHFGCKTNLLLEDCIKARENKILKLYGKNIYHKQSIGLKNVKKLVWKDMVLKIML